MIFPYKEKNYEVELIKKNNKNTYVRVRENKIYVTTNYFTSEKRIKKLLEENKSSIGKMIERSRKIEEKKELFLLFGNYYDIVYGDFEKNIIIEEGKIYVVSEEYLKKWLDQYIHTTYYNLLMYYQRQFEENIPIPTLKVRKMKTRWGVCNVKTHNITLNLELIRYDVECLKYVIIHELSHFLVHNHSKEFWKIVEKYCPNYKEIRKKLRS